MIDKRSDLGLVAAFADRCGFHAVVCGDDDQVIDWLVWRGNLWTDGRLRTGNKPRSVQQRVSDASVGVSEVFGWTPPPAHFCGIM